jgi:hypothetical protein
MTKKPATTRKKASSKKGPAKRRAPAGPKTQVNVRGNIIAKRDVVMGDQKNITTAYNYQPWQIANIHSADEFRAELQKVRTEIERLKGQPQLPAPHKESLAVVEGHMSQVMEEMEKPRPLGARISATLTGAKAVLDSLAGGVTSAVGLGAALAGLGQIALKVFGG